VPPPRPIGKPFAKFKENGMNCHHSAKSRLNYQNHNKLDALYLTGSGLIVVGAMCHVSFICAIIFCVKKL
jgi:hypothetical protein